MPRIKGRHWSRKLRQSTCRTRGITVDDGCEQAPGKQLEMKLCKNAFECIQIYDECEGDGKMEYRRELTNAKCRLKGRELSELESCI